MLETLSEASCRWMKLALRVERSKGKGSPRTEVIGVSGLSATSLYLNSNKPEIKSLRDFTEKDRIALPGIKTSLSAVVLQMAVAKEFSQGRIVSCLEGGYHWQATAESVREHLSALLASAGSQHV